MQLRLREASCFVWLYTHQVECGEGQQFVILWDCGSHGTIEYSAQCSNSKTVRKLSQGQQAKVRRPAAGKRGGMLMQGCSDGIIAPN